MTDYLKVVYDENKRPYTDYPAKLCSHLFSIFKMQAGMKFLEVGCGRGEFLRHFKNLGLEVYGVDISNEAPKFQPDIQVKVCNVENEPLPFADNTFDIIYSKSFLEHLYYPDKFFKEAIRILKGGGILLSLVPDWEANYKIYFDDYTHHTPFTKVALEDVYKIFGFSNVEVFKFRQLPLVWKYPFLNYFCAVISPFIPVRTKNKFLRWSRELMLVGSGRKAVAK